MSRHIDEVMEIVSSLVKSAKTRGNYTTCITAAFYRGYQTGHNDAKLEIAKTIKDLIDPELREVSK